MEFEMKKMGSVFRKMVVVLAAVLVLSAAAPASAMIAQAQGTLIPMPGFVVEQWSAPRLMSIGEAYNVRVLPNTSAQKLGKVQPGTFVNAWGQTDTGWYFIDFNGQMGYVRYEAGVPVDLMDAQAKANALAAYQRLTGQAAVVQAQPAAQAAQSAAPVQNAAAQAAAQMQPAAPAAVVFIGDSRMVGMERDLIEGVGVCPVTVVAKSGARHEWLESTGIPLANNVIGNGTKVLLNMGVNDLDSVRDYLPMVNAWAAAWTARGAQVYYASVNPVFPNPYNMTEERVTVFNRELRAGLIPQVTWIDSNTYLKQVGIKCNDGIHYMPLTNLVLYQYYVAMMGL